RVAPHDLYHDYAIVGFGAGKNAVDGFGYNIHGSVKTEGVVGAGKIVVDGFGKDDNFDALVALILGDGKSVGTPDSNQSLDLVLVQCGNTFFEAVGFLGWIGSRSAQNGAPAMKNSADTTEVERHVLVFDEAAPAFEKADELIGIVENPFAHHGTDNCVQAGAIAPAGQHSDFHCVLLSLVVGQYGLCIAVCCCVASASLFYRGHKGTQRTAGSGFRLHENRIFWSGNEWVRSGFA